MQFFFPPFLRCICLIELFYLIRGVVSGGISWLARCWHTYFNTRDNIEAYSLHVLCKCMATWFISHNHHIRAPFILLFYTSRLPMFTHRHHQTNTWMARVRAFYIQFHFNSVLIARLLSLFFVVVVLLINLQFDFDSFNRTVWARA